MFLLPVMMAAVEQNLHCRMVQFLFKYEESDQTKEQNGHRKCFDEGNHDGPGVATLFVTIKVIQWWQQNPHGVEIL